MRHKNLASERTRLDMNQEQLAEKLGTDLKTIHEYETYKKPMPAEFALDAAAFFGCSLDYLLDRTDERLPVKQTT